MRFTELSDSHFGWGEIDGRTSVPLLTWHREKLTIVLYASRRVNQDFSKIITFL